MGSSTKNSVISVKNATINGEKTHRGRPITEQALAVFLYYHGLSMNEIAKILRASPSTILQWKVGIVEARRPNLTNLLILNFAKLWTIFENLWVINSVEKYLRHLSKLNIFFIHMSPLWGLSSGPDSVSINIPPRWGCAFLETQYLFLRLSVSGKLREK